MNKYTEQKVDHPFIDLLVCFFSGLLLLCVELKRGGIFELSTGINIDCWVYFWSFVTQTRIINFRLSDLFITGFGGIKWPVESWAQFSCSMCEHFAECSALHAFHAFIVCRCSFKANWIRSEYYTAFSLMRIGELRDAFKHSNCIHTLMPDENMTLTNKHCIIFFAIFHFVCCDAINNDIDISYGRQILVQNANKQKSMFVISRPKTGTIKYIFSYSTIRLLFLFSFRHLSVQSDTFP